MGEGLTNAKPLKINEITTSHFTNAPRNDISQWVGFTNPTMELKSWIAASLRSSQRHGDPETSSG